MAIEVFLLFIGLVLATKQKTESVDGISEQIIAKNDAENPILVKIEEDEYFKKVQSKYIGVSYNAAYEIWQTQRWSKHEKRKNYNGTYKDEETAAHASDTLARKLIVNGEQNHKLNFPDDETEVYPEEKNTTSKYIGVSFNEKFLMWHVQRWSRNEKKTVYNGYHKDEETAAHASDTLARKLMENGEQKLKLNFPDDDTEVYSKEKFSSKYIGVTYSKTQERWRTCRRSKNEKKKVYYGCYKDEETAAHASDTLARKFMANSEQNHRLNFPDDDTEVHPEEARKYKRKRPDDFNVSQNDGTFEKFE